MTGKNKNKILLILIFILIVICVLYFGISQYIQSSEEKAESKAAAEAEAGRIWATQIENVTAIGFDTKVAQVSFVLENDVWYYDDDRAFPVDQSRLDSLAAIVANLEASRQFTEPDALADYGLEVPRITVTVTEDSGNVLQLLIGNSYNGEYYLKTTDSDIVYTIGSALANAVQDKELYDFVMAESLPAVSAEKIQTMEVQIDGVSYRLERNVTEDVEDETEAMVETWTYAIDGEIQESDNGIGLNLASALSGMKVSGCVDYNADVNALADYVLDEPVMQISYSFEGEDGIESVVISVGSLTEDRESYYVKTEESAAVNLISAGTVDGIKGYFITE